MPVKTLAMTSSKGKLILIPCSLGDTAIDAVLPLENTTHINSCSEFIVENIRTARRFLIKSNIKTAIDDLEFHLLNKHTKAHELSAMLNCTAEGKNIGLLSEAGCPGIADPGADIVKIAHSMQIAVIPLVGPSSILLSLMASGLNGQNFAFSGYLPKDRAERKKRILFLEDLSLRQQQTQLFIETPYRNNHMLEDLCQYCHPNTILVVASNLTTESENITRDTIKNWRKKSVDLNKKPSVFLIHKY
jgi:16S rRNA (cytidine1402-2'-O)-methyltransferase